MYTIFDFFISSNILLEKTIFLRILPNLVALNILGFNIGFCLFLSVRLILVILTFVLTCLLILVLLLFNHS